MLIKAFWINLPKSLVAPLSYFSKFSSEPILFHYFILKFKSLSNAYLLHIIIDFFKNTFFNNYFKSYDNHKLSLLT